MCALYRNFPLKSRFLCNYIDIKMQYGGAALESSLDAIIQSALSKKKNDRDATGTQKYIWPDDGESW